ncbi:MAG: EamA family transporter [Lachnospira sp.]
MDALYVVLAAISWSLANVCFQIFNSTTSVSSFWFNGVRLIMASILLIIILLFRHDKKGLVIFKNKKDTFMLVLYGLSIVMMQTTFYYAISISNAGTATTLQYLSPAVILFLVCIKEFRLPKKLEITAVLLAVLGIVVIATHLDFSQMYLSGEVLFWGVSSAVSMAAYTLTPQGLLKKYDTLSITAYAMPIAAVQYIIIIRPWNYAPEIVTPQMLLIVLGITLMSSIIPFITYNVGIKRIGAVRAAIICALEPLMSTVFAIMAGTSLTIWDGLGLGAIITAVILSAKK